MLKSSERWLRCSICFRSYLCYNNFSFNQPVGTWRSQVAHTLGVRGVGGSNPPVPTTFFRGAKMEDLKAQVINPVGLIDYQEGSAVSREILKSKTGTITIFAFDKGQGLSEHTAPFDATVYCLEGKVEVTISGNPLQLKAGEMIIMPADEPHALSAVEKFKMLLIMIRY